MEKNTKELTSADILDEFFYDGKKILVLNNETIDDADEDSLILCKVAVENAKLVVKPLSDKEYDGATVFYEKLLEIIDGEDEE